MGQLARFGTALKITGGYIFVVIIYFRVFMDYLLPYATEDFAGPFSFAAEMMVWAVPVAGSIVVVAAWGWVLISPVQEEKARAIQRP